MLLFNKDLFKICYSDGLFGAGLLGNWWFIFKKVDYFDSFAKSPFNHLWYLGVQEQALLIIGIIIFILNKKLSNTWKRKQYFQWILLGASIIFIALSYFVFDVHNINRSYYGTDTRIYELFLGAFLATIVNSKTLSKKEDGKNYIFINLFSILLIGIFIFLSFNLSKFSFWLYKGGFFLIDLLCSLLLINSCKAGGVVEKIGKTKVISLGAKISFGVYLWHYPILILTRLPFEVKQMEPNYLLIRLALIIIMAISSYIFVEKFNKINYRFHPSKLKSFAFRIIGLVAVFIFLFAGYEFSVKADIYNKQMEEKQRILEEKIELKEKKRLLKRLRGKLKEKKLNLKKIHNIQV